MLTRRPSARSSTSALLTELEVWPSTASSVPTVLSSTRTTSSATGGSTSTAPRPRASTARTTRSGPRERPPPGAVREASATSPSTPATPGPRLPRATTAPPLPPPATTAPHPTTTEQRQGWIDAILRQDCILFDSFWEIFPQFLRHAA